MLKQKEIIFLNNTDKKLNLIYLTNSLGEETGAEEIPEEICEWYKNLGDDSIWLNYLVRIDEKYGVLSLQEVSNPQDDNWEEAKHTYLKKWQDTSYEEGVSHLKNVCNEISERIDFTVLLGEETGIYGRHEICIFIPYDTDSQNMKKALDSIKDIDLTF